MCCSSLPRTSATPDAAAAERLLNAVATLRRFRTADPARRGAARPGSSKARPALLSDAPVATARGRTVASASRAARSRRTSPTRFGRGEREIPYSVITGCRRRITTMRRRRGLPPRETGSAPHDRSASYCAGPGPRTRRSGSTQWAADRPRRRSSTTTSTLESLPLVRRSGLDDRRPHVLVRRRRPDGRRRRRPHPDAAISRPDRRSAHGRLGPAVPGGPEEECAPKTRRTGSSTARHPRHSSPNARGSSGALDLTASLTSMRAYVPRTVPLDAGRGRVCSRRFAAGLTAHSCRPCRPARACPGAGRLAWLDRLRRVLHLLLLLHRRLRACC